MEEQLNILIERYPQLAVCKEDIKRAYEILSKCQQNFVILQRDKKKAYPQPLTDGKKAYPRPLPKGKGEKRGKWKGEKRGKWKGEKRR